MSRPFAYLIGGIMLSQITGLPPGVIGFEVSGKLSTDDYHGTLLPAIQKAAADGEVRIMIVMPTFEGLSGGAFWQDLKIGVEQWGKWKRIALVTDIDWMRHAIDWFGWMTPGEVKHFALAE